MFGWRARIGLLVPMGNAVIEPELAPVLPRGVSAHTVRLTTMVRADMPGNAVELCPALVELGVDVAGYACAETSFLDGVDANAWIAERVSEHAGVPTVTASGAMLEALEALEVERVALACPYPPASVDALVGFLQTQGLKVVGVAARDLVSAAAGVREWALTNNQPPATAAALAREADEPSAQAVLVSATNLRTLPVIRSLESDLAKPVVSTNSAMLHALLGRAGVGELPTALGMLAGAAAA